MNGNEVGPANVQRTARRWLGKSLGGNAFLGVLLFASAGTLRWSMGWTLAALFAGVAVTTYLLVDAALIVERNLRRRSTETWDNVLLGVYGLISVLVVPVVAGLDMR